MALTLVWTAPPGPALQTPLTGPQRQAQPVLRTPVGTRLPSLSHPGPWEPPASLPPSGHQSPEGFLQHLGVPGGTHSWGDRGGFREPENTLDTTQHFTGAHLLVLTNEGLALANGALCFSDVFPAQVRQARPVWRKALSEEGAAGEVVSRPISPAHHGLHRWGWPSGGGWVGVSVRGPKGGKSLLTADRLLPVVITNPTWSTRAARLGGHIPPTPRDWLARPGRWTPVGGGLLSML